MKTDSTFFSQEASDYARVEQAIHYLEEHFQEQLSLQEIAAQVHLSSYHFQRLFKRWAGVSPAQFQQYLTLEYARSQLLESSSILQAALNAGLSGSARLHDLFVTFEAVTPGEYKRRGEGLEIEWGIHDSPFGRCLLALTGCGICALRFIDGDESQAVAEWAEEWPLAHLAQSPEKTLAFVKRIFSPAPDRQPFHLFLKGTNFQVRVWQALLSIPAGTLVSYQQVANLLGSPSGVRAAAHAVAQNPVGYLIPCHRVIGSAGDLRGYRWGLARKQALLGWEAAQRLRSDQTA